MKSSGCSIRKQFGQTLLAFVLVMIIGSSYLLVRALNTNTPKLAASEQAAYKLKLAKQALIGYAVTYPDNVNPEEGPGYLLCPDTNGDGLAETNCSGAAIGRFPWKTLELTDVYDASGQTIWYALSENYRYGPNKRIPLNSETPGTLTVDGVGDYVAILFAPGAPVTGQTRTLASNNVSDFLDGENNDGDTDFVTTLPSPNVKQLDGVYDANGNLVFNDRLLTISRGELMQAVEKRVLGEFNQILSNYFASYNAYPWLTSFADPKSLVRQIQGQADSGSTATELIDSTQDFQQLNVRINDFVYNTTDGSIGLVASNPTQADRITVTALYQGAENDFDENDDYIIISRDRNTPYVGVASGGSVGLVLEDVTKDFAELAIAPGDVLENLTDGSSGIIDDISGNTITVSSLTGGATNQFSNLDDYMIRSNYGSHSGASGTLTLQDSNKDFVTMGVAANDLVWNLTDDSMGRVASVTNTTLTIDELLFGTDNDFDTNDLYMIARHDATTNIREGLLSFHEVGVPFQTGFQLDWAITPAVADFDLTNANPLQQNYITQKLASESRVFADTVGACVWSTEGMANCYGYFRDYLSIDGRMTSGNNTDRVIDNVAQFITDNVKTGDIVQNYDDETSVMSGTTDAGTSGTTLVDMGNNFSALIPYSYLIHNNSTGARGLIAEIIDANTIVVEPYTGSSTTPITFSNGQNYTIYQPRIAVVDYIVNQNELDTDQVTGYNPDFDTNEYYRVVPSARSYTGTATNNDNNTLEDTSVDFIAMGVEVGDIVYNSHANGDWGQITAVTSTTLDTVLYGDHEHFRAGESYTVYYDYVYSREHIVRPRFSGNQVTNAVSEVRTRDVCHGYNADCSTVSATAFNGNASTPLLTVIDYEEDQTTAVGTITFIPDTGSTGSLKVSNIKYSLAETSGDIPGWLIQNDWHKLIYVAYSSGDAPGAASVCSPGTNCLEIDITWRASTTTQNDKRALLLSAGGETDTLRDANCNVLGTAVAQDRTTGIINSYFELDNCDAGDDVFTLDRDASNFNDQVRVMATAP
ncbi:MAG: hypothetical protein RLT87_08135 [Gammaproteobacteria bacterium]